VSAPIKLFDNNANTLLESGGIGYQDSYGYQIGIVEERGCNGNANKGREWITSRGGARSGEASRGRARSGETSRRNRMEQLYFNRCESSGFRILSGALLDIMRYRLN
jgi:hypothetical protein